MSRKFTRKGRSRKAADRPKKPYPDFPFTPHASRAWQMAPKGRNKTNLHASASRSRPPRRPEYQPGEQRQCRPE
jgi:hypothetical protein